MPLYEYQCKQCNHVFERIQKFSDPPMKVCSKCGGAVEQLISAPAIQFKGSGWYVTDYAHKSGAPASKSGNGNGSSDVKAESSSSSSSSESKSSESKSESKPATATSSKDKK